VAKNVNDINLPKEIVFVEGEFGWRYDVLKSTNEKANYLFTAIAYNEDYNALKSVVDILKKKGIKCNFLNSNYEEYDYFNENGELKDEKDINFNLIDGYVDHGTELKEFLNDICYDEDKLLSFLFSPLSFIITGNDNDGSNEYC
jgi:ketol-acid reductoisomerase